MTETNIDSVYCREHIKLSGRLNAITIINCLTKADLKFLYPFPSLAD